MYLIDQLINLFMGTELPLGWGVLIVLMGYLIYQNYQITHAMEEKWQEMTNLIKENRHHHADTQEQMQYLKDMFREDLLPVLRHIEKDVQQIAELERTIEEAKHDQRGWFGGIRDDFNQFRSEFRDILKIFLNGRKRD